MAQFYAVALVLSALACHSATTLDRDEQLIQLTASNFSSLEIVPPSGLAPSAPALNASRSFNLPITLNSTYSLTCEGDTYGRGMNVDDCLSALGNFKQSGESVTFAQRYNPAITSDMYPLPWRWMGSMQSFHSHQMISQSSF